MSRELRSDHGSYIHLNVATPLHVQASPSSFVGGAGLQANECVGGNSFFVAFIDSESVAIAILWRLLTPTVGVNSLVQKLIIPSSWPVYIYIYIPCSNVNTLATLFEFNPRGNTAMVALNCACVAVVLRLC